jgi:hypothetical protein
MEIMRTNLMKQFLGAAGLLAAALLGPVAAEAATTVNLSAQRATLTLPDGAVAPMWSYCGAADPTLSTGITVGGTCPATAPVPPAVQPWTQGPTIIVPAGDVLTINLSNALPSPTSITILGQLGGGLGQPNYVASPAHPGTNVTTWTTNATVAAAQRFTPPGQGPRARSFVPEVDGINATTAASAPGVYTWSNLKPGTYLYESGSRPSLQVPMGLYGVIIVTAPSTVSPVAGGANTAYLAVVPGTAPATTVPLAYDADATFLFSEVDPVQNAAVDTAALAMAGNTAPTFANRTAFAALEQRVLPPAGPATLPNPTPPVVAAGQDCGTIACYPPAVNYAPTYFLLNGQSYDKTAPALSAAIVSDTTSAKPPTGRVLVRLLNAGLKTHIPTLVGLNSTLVAEDGNLLPDVSVGLVKSANATAPVVAGKVQSAILLPAGKTADVAIYPATAAAGKFTDTIIPVIDRQLSLSAGSNGPTGTHAAGGMQGFLAIAANGTTQATLTATTSGVATLLPAAALAAANPDVFYVAANATTFSGNVLANDVGVTTAKVAGAPLGGTLKFSADGNFTFTAAAGTTIANNTTFTYNGIANGVAVGPVNVTLLVNPAAANDTVSVPATPLTFTSQVASLVRVPHPGVLAGASSSGNFSLQALYTGTVAPPAATGVPLLASTLPPCTAATGTTGSCVVTLLADGAFTATATAAGTYSFPYTVVDAQGKSASTTANVVFLKGTGMTVTVTDAVTGTAAGADYRWVIEEDQTFVHDPGNAGFVPPAFPVTLTNIAYTPVTLANGLVSPQVTVNYATPPTNFGGFVIGTYVQIQGAKTDAFNGVYRINAVTGTATTTGTFTYTLWETPPALPALAASSGLAYTGQSLATNFHRSYMPVVAAGCTGVKSCNAAQTVAGLGAVASPVSLPSDVALDPTKRYFLSVLPGDAGAPLVNPVATPIGHSMGAAQVTATAAGVWNPVTVLVPENPVPPGQMSFFVFEDNNPISGDVDDGEPPLGGFEIVIYDTRGSSGDQAGQITYDLFNQPLTNSLANTPGVGTDGIKYANLCPTTPNGAQAPVGVIYTCMPVLDATGNDISPFTGMALVKNVIPGRIDVQAHPAAWRAGKGEEWIQVSTLEGTPNNDSFVHAGEPAYWQEFGPPGFHSKIGFITKAHLDAANQALHDSLVATAPATPFVNVTGRVTNLHMDRPPEAKLNDSCHAAGTPADCARAALNYTQCYVALNAQAGNGAAVAFAKCDANGNFTLANVPPDTYELFIWDEWLDQIKAKKSVVVPATVANGAVITTGDTPVFNWFTRIQETVYLDLNGNGVRDPGEPGLVNLVANVRFRDGTFSNKLVTDASGNAFHNELFPLFNWYVLENDQTRYKNTGVHVIYDAGGVPDQTSLTSALAPKGEYFPTLGVINSTEKFTLPPALQIPGAKYNPGKTERIDPPGIITEGMQGYINQTEFLEWGKQPFAPGENGGISGLVYFASVRAFDDPRLKVQNLSEPGIPRVTVNLYQRTTNVDGSTSDVLVDTTTTTSWDDWANGTTNGVPNMSCAGNPPRVKPNANGTLPAYTAGVNDPFVNYTLGGDGNQYKCYDGQHAFNQVQPAVYDGYYAFPTASCTGCTQVVVTNNATGAPLLNPDGSAPGAVNVLPPGQYVVEVVRPDGFEMTKEEDKNILIGDGWISAGPQQFGNLVNIFILPDQATLNDSNPEGQTLFAPPCVGLPHLVPDFLTVVPEALQVAPYAGQVRNLCDKKLVTVVDQTASNADFQLWTPAPIAGHVSGLMLNDAAAEFDPYSPSFGEKFALPNAPISVRDFNGVEILRSYTDKWGTFDFLNVSTWQANVPNPSGYAPNMLTYCMNDPGPTPILNVTTGLPTGQYRVDPYYNPQYSDFCYNWPILPGVTTYLDTPVLPVSAFAAHYAPVDCQYATATPAIQRVDGNWTPTSGQAVLPPGVALPGSPVGPFVDIAAGAANLVITALGDTSVLNPAYAGPTALPGTTYAANRIVRHYGFGTAAGRVQLISPAGVAVTLSCGTWNDLKLTCAVPAFLAGASTPANPNANGQTYQLAVTTSAGVRSVDTVTVTVTNSTRAGYRAPWYVAAPKPGTALGTANTPPHPIQDAIDKALPGDLILVDAGTYPELVVMWKPVRLQGVGAASTTIQATKYPNNKVADWRVRINLLFGLDAQGNQLTDAGGTALPAQIDPLPGQEITGGIVRLEPSVLATEEGAGITVVAADHQADVSPPDPNPANGEDPRGNPMLPTCAPLTGPAPNPLANFASSTPFGFYPGPTPGSNPTANTPVPATVASRAYSDFACFPSRIDGLGVTGSDAGGGIYVNGWAHNLEIANNRVYGNAGTYNGGVRVGQPYLETQTLNAFTHTLAYDVNVRIHHNSISTNGTVEANAAPGTPVGTSGAGGGLAIESGSDNFAVYNNWICGNFSAGDGGGVGILGMSTPGSFTSNTVIFNEAYQQTGANYGGGVAVEGEPGSPSTGVGNLLIDSNVIQGNSVRSGSGGGLRLADINGTEITRDSHYTVTVTNNNIVNNEAGWVGGGISIVDTLYATIEENTIVNNDSMGLAGNLMNSTVGFGATAATTSPTTGVPGPAGIASETTSPGLVAAVNAIATAARASGRFAANQAPAAVAYSQPLLRNNIVYQNRSFLFDSSSGTAKILPSNRWTDALTPAALTPLTAQTTVGQCVAGASYWDLGVLGDQSVIPGSSVAGNTGPRLNLTYSELTASTAALYAGAGNRAGPAAQSDFVHAYCNGGRVLPGAQFEPGSPFQPNFQVNAAATLDESGNFVDLSFGPLSQVLAAGYYDTLANSTGTDRGLALGNTAPYNHDIHAVVRPHAPVRNNGSGWDLGAAQYVNATATTVCGSLTPNFQDYGNELLGVTTKPPVTFTLTNTCTTRQNTAISVSSSTLSTDFVISAPNCPAALNAGASCSIFVAFKPTTVGLITGALNGMGATSILQGTGVFGSFTITPPAINFGKAQPGVRSATQLVSITNNSPLTENFRSVLATGTPAAFRVINGAGTTCQTAAGVPVPLASGATCTIALAYQPAATALLGVLQTSALAVSEIGVINGVTNPVVATVSLSGTPADPAAALAPNPANFGTVASGNAAAAVTITFTYTNTGGGAIDVGNATITGAAGYTVNGNTDNCSGNTIAAGASCTLQVTFAPAAGGAAGARIATLTLNGQPNSGNGPNPTATAALTGTAQ